jgi:2-oxoglutarate dehydrogenase E2 component (dihydrolipoamide succinyltransferase)
MSIELKVPEVGESVTEVFIGEWLKSEGDEVEEGEALVELESEKATFELPARRGTKVPREEEGEALRRKPAD